ncbi:hypothetical protein FJZ18_03450 [Candidatus Pacearchaeota archaeon]|nr:hypothetical protein [Candidatus Pacearchaeota archaeon]
MKEQNKPKDLETRTEQSFTFRPTKRKLVLEYQTPIFLYTFDVEATRFNEENKKSEHYRAQRKTPVQVFTNLELSERQVLPKNVTWYIAYVDHFDDIKQDGRYDRLRANPDSIAISAAQSNEKNIASEIVTMMLQKFPYHNACLKVNIHSAVKTSYQKDDYKNIADSLKPLIMQVTRESIEKGGKQLQCNSAVNFNWWD